MMSFSTRQVVAEAVRSIGFMLQQNLNNICNLSYTPGQALEHQTLPSDDVFSTHAKRERERERKKKKPSIIVFRKVWTWIS